MAVEVCVRARVGGKETGSCAQCAEIEFAAAAQKAITKAATATTNTATTKTREAGATTTTSKAATATTLQTKLPYCSFMCCADVA